MINTTAEKQDVKTDLKIHFEEFNRQHFEEYRSWFSDETLREMMSYPDDVWFNYLQSDDEVTCLAVMDQDDRFVGVNQINRDPDAEGYIAIAVKPELRGTGVAQKAIKTLLNSDYLDGLNRLIGFVYKNNTPSRQALESSGFEFNGAEDEDGFLEYVYDLRPNRHSN